VSARFVPSCAGKGMSSVCALSKGLMRQDGRRGVMRHRGPRTTVPGDPSELGLDLVERAFTATAPDPLWVADITYIRTLAG